MSRRFVLDSSVAIAWCFEDEASSTVDQILDSLDSDEAIVPVTWPAEVSNALLAGERRKRITPAETARSLLLLRSLNIQLDNQDARRQVEEWLVAARSYNLSIYDAAFLALAVREGLPLATLDRALQRAARKLGVKLLIA